MLFGLLGALVVRTRNEPQEGTASRGKMTVPWVPQVVIGGLPNCRGIHLGSYPAIGHRSGTLNRKQSGAHQL